MPRQLVTARWIVLLLVAISWAPTVGPLQLLAYTGPAFIVLLAVLWGAARPSVPDVLFLLFFGLYSLAGSVFHSDTWLLNPLVGLLTYSSLLLLLIRFRDSDPDALIESLAVYTAGFSILEFLVGMGQLWVAHGALIFSSMAAGDVVVGTLGTNSHLFAGKMLFQGLLLATVLFATTQGRSRYRKLWLAGFFSAMFGALFASALATMILFFGALSVWGLAFALRVFLIRIKPGMWSFSRARAAALFGGVVFLLVLGGTLLRTQSSNVSLTAETARRVVMLDFSDQIRFQKFLTFQYSLRSVLLRDTRTALFGLGLGRYSSRAAMILSGGYLRNQPGWIPVSRSPETTRVVYKIWNRHTWERYRGSILGMPTSSAQSVLLELGFVGTVALLGFFASLAVRAGTLSRSRSVGRVQRTLLTALPAFLLCLLALALVDLSLEYASLASYVYLVALVALSAAWPPRRAPLPQAPIAWSLDNRPRFATLPLDPRAGTSFEDFPRP